MAGYSIPLSRWFYQGQVSAGAKVYVYQSGTTTPVTVYSDSSLGTPITNPVTCDSNGEAVFYVGSSVSLRLYVTTSGGTLIRDIDPVFPVPDLTGPIIHGQCILSKSGSNLLLSPYRGNKLIINGTVQAVTSPTLSASGLNTSTLYYIYAYMSGSTMTLEASTTGYTTDSTGIEVKTGNATRTLVGMARTISGPAWQFTAAQRFVRSWFNDFGVAGLATFTTNRTTTSTTRTEINTEMRVEFLAWARDLITASISGGCSKSTSSGNTDTFVYYDGTTQGAFQRGQSASNDILFPVGFSDSRTLTEGYHYATLFGNVNTAGTATWISGTSLTVRVG